MKIAVKYLCPCCAQHYDLKPKQFDALSKTQIIECVSCHTDLHVVEDDLPQLEQRRKVLQDKAKKLLIPTGIVLTSTLLEFGGVIPLGGLIAGYSLGAIAYFVIAGDAPETLTLTCCEVGECESPDGNQ